MNDFKCPFCGSQKLKIDTPFLKPVTHEPIQTFCCRPQAKNQEFIKKRYHPTLGRKPTTEEVSEI